MFLISRRFFFFPSGALSVTAQQLLEAICRGEWRWSGVNGGIMDQYTSINAKARSRPFLFHITGLTVTQHVAGGFFNFIH